MRKHGLKQATNIFVVTAVIMFSFPLIISAQTTLTVSGWWNIRGFDELVTRFEAQQPGVTVEPVGGSEGAYWDPLIVQAAAGNGPDVVWTNFGGIPTIAPAGVLMPLDDLLAKDDIVIERDSFTAAWNQMTYDGVVHAVPFFMASSGVYYNQSMLEASGLTAPSDWDWNDLLMASDRMYRQDESGNTTQWGFTTDGWGLTSGKAVAPFLWSNGGDIVGEDGRFALDRPESLDALRWFIDTTFNRPSVYSPPDHEILPSWQAFPVGMIGMWSTATSNNSTLISQVTATNLFEWDVAPLPKSPHTGQLVTYLQSDGLGVGQFAAQPELAWEFVKLIISSEFQQEVISGEFGLIPVRQDAIHSYVTGDFPPANKQVFVDAAITARDFTKLPDSGANKQFHDTLSSEWAATVLTLEEDPVNFVERMRMATSHFFEP